MIKNIIIFLLFSTIAIGGYLTNTVLGKLNTAEAALTTMQASMSALRLKHRKDILKTKIKERGKRVVVAIPVAGLVALGWFEKEEYDEWKVENPEGTFSQYVDEVTASVKEVADEIVDSHCREYDTACEGLKNQIKALTGNEGQQL